MWHLGCWLLLLAIASSRFLATSHREADGIADLADRSAKIRQYAALGLKLMITEIDLGVLPARYRGADLSVRESMTPEQRAPMDPYLAGLPDAVARKQAALYRQGFEMTSIDVPSPLRYPEFQFRESTGRLPV